jgi:hypothetical protein
MHLADALQIVRAVFRSITRAGGVTMAEVVVQFDSPVKEENGRTYSARVCGREAEDGLWHGWIEFDPADGSPVLRTLRETTQPNHKDLEYWATGLTAAYLEGALERAKDPETPDLRPPSVPARPAFDRPAPSVGETDPSSHAGAGRPKALLDPFKVYAQGEDLLRDELAALDEGHLRNIVRAHELVDEAELDLQSLSRQALAEMIVSAVRRRVA